MKKKLKKKKNLKNLILVKEFKEDIKNKVHSEFMGEKAKAQYELRQKASEAKLKNFELDYRTQLLAQGEKVDPKILERAALLESRVESAAIELAIDQSENKRLKEEAKLKDLANKEDMEYKVYSAVYGSDNNFNAAKEQVQQGLNFMHMMTKDYRTKCDLNLKINYLLDSTVHDDKNEVMKTFMDTYFSGRVYNGEIFDEFTSHELNNIYNGLQVFIPEYLKNAQQAQT